MPPQRYHHTTDKTEKVRWIAMKMVRILHRESKIGTRVRTLQHPSLKFEKEV